jgi:hypothetical protein
MIMLLNLTIIVLLVLQIVLNKNDSEKIKALEKRIQELESKI